MSAPSRNPIFDAEPLRVMVVSTDTTVLSTIGATVRREGDHLIDVASFDDALESARIERPHVAFVDLTGGDGLALVHHLPAVCPGACIVTMAGTAELELATEALSMGASGLVLLPPTGDAVLGRISEVRARRAAERRQHDLEDELARARRRAELMDRVVRLARGSGHSDAVRAITESLREISESRGAAVYATFDRGGDCVRLSALGSAVELPSVGKVADVLASVESLGARSLPLLSSHGEIGIVVLDQLDPRKRSEVESMTDLAAAVLSLVDSRQSTPAGALKDEHGRTYTSTYFNDVAAREIEKAKRHGRRVSIACIRLDPAAPKTDRIEMEETVASSVRDTDTLSKLERDEYFLLMPETGALGAHACRRRVLSRAEGDRRSRTGAERRPPSRATRSVPVSIGVATYPHDGRQLDALVECARRRAIEEERSVVHGLGLVNLSLPDIVDTLLGRAMLGAGVRTPYPIDLSAPAMLALVTSACREARRGGALAVHVTLQPGLGLATAARQALTQSGGAVPVHVLDARNTPGCLDVEAMVIQAEHGTWVCCGRSGKERFSGVHAADPLLGDLLLKRLIDAGSMRSGCRAHRTGSCSSTPTRSNSWRPLHSSSAAASRWPSPTARSWRAQGRVPASSTS